jgi:hypothetical protein
MFKSILILSISFLACQENPGKNQLANVTNPPSSPTEAVINKLEITDTDDVAQPDGPKMVFDHKRYDYGEIWHADKVVHEFEFLNEGGNDLIIKNVKVSCGCTTPEYSDKPVKPGEKGTIKITFNSVGKWGRQKATAKIITNEVVSEAHTLVMSGLVKVKPKEEN